MEIEVSTYKITKKKKEIMLIEKKENKKELTDGWGKY